MKSTLLNKLQLIIILVSIFSTNLNAQISCEESFSDNFDNDLSNWTNPTSQGNWEIIDGVLRGDYPISCGSTTCPQSELILNEEYQLHDNWKSTIEFTEYEAYSGVNSYFAKFALFKDSNNKFKIQVGEQTAGIQDSVLISLSHWNGSWQSHRLEGLSSTRRISFPNKWNSTELNHASIFKKGTNYSVYLNDEFLISFNDIYLNGEGSVGFGTYGGFEASSFLLESCSYEFDLVITANSYSETDDLDSLAKDLHGESGELADWTDLLNSIYTYENIEKFYQNIGFSDGDAAYVSLENERFYGNTDRHFYIQRFDDGPYSNFLVHKQYETLYLGSWNNLDLNFVSKKNSSINPFRLSNNTYSELANLDSISINKFGNNSRLADWSDIKNYIDSTGSSMDFINQIGLADEGTALVQINGQRYLNNGDRHYYLQRFDDGPYSGFLVHDQMDNLYIGSWYDLNMNVLIDTETDYDLLDNSISVNNEIQIENLNLKAELYINDFGDLDRISAYQFDLDIPAGLTFTGLDTTATFSSMGTYQTNVIDNTLKVAFSTTDYLENDSLLVKILFKADGSGDYEIAPYNFVLNNTDIDSVRSGILSVVELLGDVDDNDSIQAYDGALTLQFSVDIDPFPAIDNLPWDNWRVAAADVDRDEAVLALDASYILQKTVDLIDDFPNAPLKSNTIELMVQQDGNELVFSTNSERLIGFNVTLPTSEKLTFNEPIYTWGESIQAVNQLENSLKIGIASHIPASGEFLRIPFSISEEQIIEIVVNKNNITQRVEITLSSETVNADINSDIVKKFNLSQNYPNPFNPSTNISFSIPEGQYVSLKVFDISGREVATLVDGYRNSGEYSVSFNASNLSSGVYFYSLETAEFTQTRRMLLIK